MRGHIFGCPITTFPSIQSMSFVETDSRSGPEDFGESDLFSIREGAHGRGGGNKKGILEMRDMTYISIGMVP